MADLEMTNEVVTMQMTDVHPLHPLLRGETRFWDPRPDLGDDSDLWVRALEMAEKYDYKFCTALYDMRSYGTRIGKCDAGYFIYPVIDETVTISAWDTKELYWLWLDKLLGPYREQLKTILSNLEDRS